MIFHPGILALITGSILVFMMLLYASFAGCGIAASWNLASSRRRQLLNERKTFLISSILNYGLAFELVGIFLFLYTTENIHPFFIGAMCATGSLNANPVGWWALLCKVVIFFSAGGWIALNYLDQHAEDFPLVPAKYFLLPVIAILVGIDLVLTISYFAGLTPEIITSCCGSLFSSTSDKISGEMATLPLMPMMTTFYGIFLGVCITAFGSLLSRYAFFRYMLLFMTGLFFVIAVASIISFISVYIYELPTHHCPFDIIQGHYSFIGYPMYVTLFGGCLFGLLPGLAQPLKGKKTLGKIIDAAERKWLWLCLGLLAAFVLISSTAIVLSNFSMKGYI